MLKSSLIPCAAVALLCAGGMVEAQTRGQEGGAAAPANTSIHVEGCVFPEAELASPKAEIIPVGRKETYVLTNAKLIAGAVPEDEVAKTIYTIVKADPEELRSLNGKRVGVVGHVSPSAKRPDLTVVSIREISGGCPMLPNL